MCPLTRIRRLSFSAWDGGKQKHGECKIASSILLRGGNDDTHMDAQLHTRARRDAPLAADLHPLWGLEKDVCMVTFWSYITS